MQGETRLRRGRHICGGMDGLMGRLDYGGSDSPTEGETRLRRERLIYGEGGLSIRRWRLV
jgi:hypothetical protein